MAAVSYPVATHDWPELKGGNRVTSKIVFILGIGRSGSTLLDLMLGSHSQGFSLGEVSKLPEIYQKKRDPAAFCPTGTFWADHFSPQDAEQLALGLSGRRLHRPIPLKVERWLRELVGRDAVLNPYTLMLQRLQQPLLIDSSKYPDWVAQRLQAREFRQGHLSAYVIHLVRDGRAVLNSYLRAFPDLTVETISQRWLVNLAQCEQVYQTIAPHCRLQVRYEQLASTPQTVLQQICAFLGIPFEPAMLEYWQHDHYPIAGSRSVRALLARYRQQPMGPATQQVYKRYYADMGLKIQLDQRWKTELEADKLKRFQQIVGDRNRPFEWNEPV